MCKRRFGYSFGDCRHLFGRPGPKRGPEPMNRKRPSLRLYDLEQRHIAKGCPRVPGKITSLDSERSAFACSRTARAAGESVTTCTSPAFISSAGRVHVAASKSICG